MEMRFIVMQWLYGQTEKIVLGGSQFHTGAVLARYEANGHLDSSFGTNGLAQTSIGFFHRILAMCLQADDKILAAGPISNASTGDNFLVARYTKNGKPDNTFGSNGAAEIDFDGSSDQAYAIAFEPDGKIVVAGVASIRSIRFGFGVARLNNDIATKVNQKIVDNASAKAIEKHFSVLLYPNPVKDIMNIKGMDAEMSYELSVMNANGNVVAQTSVSHVSTYTWNLASLTKGVYYLNLTICNLSGERQGQKTRSGFSKGQLDNLLMKSRRPAYRSGRLCAYWRELWRPRRVRTLNTYSLIAQVEIFPECSCALDVLEL
jgi:uncharacterized delta-60 repeat protein